LRRLLTGVKPSQLLIECGLKRIKCFKEEDKMKKIMVASLNEGAGKTSVTVGLITALEKTFGYIKPFGDRLIYKRKRNWDYDSSLIIDLYDMKEDPESITLGFDHSKLKYVYDEDSMAEAVNDMASKASQDKELLFVEGGMSLSYGASLYVDSLTIARKTKSRLVLVLSGDSDSIIDDVAFLKRSVDFSGIDFGGLIINKVKDIDEFHEHYLPFIEETGLPVLGLIPYKDQLTYFTIDFLAEKLYARIIAGEKNINKTIKNIFIGAMSTDESLRNPLFNKEQKFLITSGDRSDLILAALESDTVGIMLTNNILPPSNLISRATEKDIPLLMVTMDTFQVARQLERTEALLTKNNNERVDFLGQLVKRYVNLEMI
jgi:BioD-like phosphotransacetylase family protein